LIASFLVLDFRLILGENIILLASVVMSQKKHQMLVCSRKNHQQS